MAQQPRPSSSSALVLILLLVTLVQAIQHAVEQHDTPVARVQQQQEQPVHASLRRRTSKDLPESIQHFRFNTPTTSSSTNDAAAEEEADGEAVYEDDGQTSPDGLKLSSTVLVVTVDGHVHALRRETGHWLWTLHDDTGIQMSGSTDSPPRAGTVTSPKPLVSSVGKRRLQEERDRRRWANESRTEDEDRADTEDENEVYIIEPHSGGDIYLYTRRGPNGEDGKMEKLPLNIAELVSMTPFTFPSDTSRMFAGRKETELISVDLKTGRLVGVFGSDSHGWCEWDDGSVRRRGGNECEEDIERRPEDLLYMSRIQYHLTIYSKSPRAVLQTLTYTTYASSTLSSPLDNQWTRTPDSRYLQPMHDGTLVCLVPGQPGLVWNVAFDSPVVSVFDIAISAPGGPQSMFGGGGKSQPLMFEQPPLDGLPMAVDVIKTIPQSTYVGEVGGELFAMSRQNYPFVVLAQPPGSTETEEEDACKGSACLVGSHSLWEGMPSPIDDTIEGPSTTRLAIDAGPASTSVAPVQPSAPSDAEVPARSSSIALLAWLYRPVRRKLKGEKKRGTVLAGVLAVLVLWIWARGLNSKDKKTLQDPVSVAQGKSTLPPPPLSSSSRDSGSSVTDQTTVSEQGSGLLPSAPIYSPAVRQVSFASDKDLPPLPPEDDEGEGDSDGDEKGDGATPKKKSRRRRGKKKKGGAREASDPMVVDSPDLGQGSPEKEKEKPTEEVEGLRKSIELLKIEPQIEMDAEPIAEDGPSTGSIGGLTVSDHILGYGSHGTVVLKGEFQGRAVAVKRLLKDFVTIATHEVALLQESDDHPHVIRYFCKEQRHTFLYIALELCPASLYDLVEQPGNFAELTEVFELKRALRQITSGIRHLHKLKIVHRDIKPQNILVAPEKHGKGVRMLISDFGLCKKLDMDESSFQQTVNHAAGSFGYRAPEVLRGQVDPNAEATRSPSSKSGTLDSSSKGGSGSGSVGGGDQTRRLTRSIDIFSLGCIFYYVLTKGEHPFGSRYEREINILRGNVSLEKLDGLGEEAIEVQDLILRMVATEAVDRPTAEAALLHPFFWNAQKRLLFVCDASDRFEIMERDPPVAPLVSLESKSKEIVGADWAKALDRTLLDNLGKYRKYDGTSVRDLLRVLRNKKHHYQDLPEPVQRTLGDLPDGFLTYFTTRFPKLLLRVYYVVAEHLATEPMFASTFRLSEDD